MPKLLNSRRTSLPRNNLGLSVQDRIQSDSRRHTVRKKQFQMGGAIEKVELEKWLKMRPQIPLSQMQQTHAPQVAKLQQKELTKFDSKYTEEKHLSICSIQPIFR